MGSSAPGAPRATPGAAERAESLSPVSIHLEAAPITSPRASSRGQRPLPAVHVATGRALPLAYGGRPGRRVRRSRRGLDLAPFRSNTIPLTARTRPALSEAFESDHGGVAAALP
jgi:hypothetical protein